ncbi:hypothetical protein CROQUDRAFT_693870 [Cronartium quercuum f. sp. fusiforme G11]|uniref:Uncharacterized protein n=1 Tax=Cronartium quercuum f. sp. fusiforme G11 TaxID=708437 RepID=A0A9P6NR97_9BASI|nr:hypothetical protein CROQUDRAFT_693870 [Cronartium quercuum f. sp. fusiforme G11]
MKTSNCRRTQKSGGPSVILNRQGFLSSLSIVVILFALIEGYVAAQLRPVREKVMKGGCDITEAHNTLFRLKMLDSEVQKMDSLMAKIQNNSTSTNIKIKAANDAICCERNQNELRSRLVSAAKFSEEEHKKIASLIEEVMNYLKAFISKKNPTQAEALKIVGLVAAKRKEGKKINGAIKAAALNAGISDGKQY